METTWNSAKSLFKDNYLQYKLTGESKYKIISDQALETMNKIVDLQSKKESPKQIHIDYLKEQDKYKGALLRQKPSSFIKESYSTKYIILGTLTILFFGLLVV
jgi:hypothetical protein